MPSVESNVTGGLLALVAVVGAALAIQAVAQPIDVKAVEAEAVATENRHCREYMSSHPDVAAGYGPKVSIESYCACEANLLVGSVAPDELGAADGG
jgi:hypothetical protein